MKLADEKFIASWRVGDRVYTTGTDEPKYSHQKKLMNVFVWPLQWGKDKNFREAITFEMAKNVINQHARPVDFNDSFQKFPHYDQDLGVLIIYPDCTSNNWRVAHSTLKDGFLQERLVFTELLVELREHQEVKRNKLLKYIIL